ADGEAAGGGKGQFGATGTDQTGNRSPEKGFRFQRQAECVAHITDFGKPAHHFGALAGLRGHQHGAAFERQGLAKLFGKRHGDGVDAAIFSAVAPACSTEARASACWRAISRSIATRPAGRFVSKFITILSRRRWSGRK